MQLEKIARLADQPQPASARFEAVGRQIPGQGVVRPPTFHRCPSCEPLSAPIVDFLNVPVKETLHPVLDFEMVFRTGSALRTTCGQHALHAADDCTSPGQAHALGHY
jgi:hypothetical protein